MKKYLLIAILLIPAQAHALNPACKAHARKPSQQFLTEFPPANPETAFRKTTQNYLKVPYVRK